MSPLPVRVMALLFLLAGLSACGGGGGAQGGSPAPSLTITNNSILPSTLQDHPYSATLTAANGVGALHWSIAPLTPTTLFVDGLSIDADTGAISGTAKFNGVAGFTATVTDSASPRHTATKGFSIDAAPLLTALPPQTFTGSQYSDLFANLGPYGGIPPLTITLTGGSLPLGAKLNAHTGAITGSPSVAGIFPATVRVQDSYSPPEVITAQFTIEVAPHFLEVMDSIPKILSLNRPFSGRVVARGGVPPYAFVLKSGTLPSGVGPIDPSGGQISGTPTVPGSYAFEVAVTDSSPVPQSVSKEFAGTIAASLGRNDTVSAATLTENGTLIASLSPYIDPPGNAPLAADNDYYKLISLPGAIVHAETFANRGCCSVGYIATDTVIEIVDGNSSRFALCNQPGLVSTNFTSPCINDDIDAGTLDSALDFKVPGSGTTPTTLYVHVLDWRGDARPDLQYQLLISGVNDPLTISPTPLRPAARGLSYTDSLFAEHGTGIVSWSVIAGSLPPGLTVDSFGFITGSATTDGTYTFTVRGTDSGTPPQTITADRTIRVVEPIAIVSSPTLPDACLNQPYSFTPQTSGGISPFVWSFFSGSWALTGFDWVTGTLSGSPSNTGTFTGTIFVMDGTSAGDAQNLTLMVKQCP